MIRGHELQVWFLAEHLVDVPVVRADQAESPGLGANHASRRKHSMVFF